MDVVQWSAQRVRAVLRSQPALDPTIRALVHKILDEDLAPDFVTVTKLAVNDLRNAYRLQRESALDSRLVIPGIDPFIAALTNTPRRSVDTFTLAVSGSELLCICDQGSGLLISAICVPRR